MSKPFKNDFDQHDLEDIFSQLNHKSRVELEELESVYKKALQQSPRDVATHLKLAHLYCLNNDLNAAIAQCETILKFNPNSTVTHLLIMDLYHQRGDFDSAIAHGEKILNLNPKSEMACNNLGNIYADKEDFEKAKAYYHQALEINPGFVGVYNNLCLLLKDMGEVEAALNCGMLALGLDPYLVPAYNNVGICYQKLHQHPQAIEMFKTGLLHDAQNPSLLYNLACSYQEQQDKELAQKTLKDFFGCFNLKIESLKIDDFNSSPQKSLLEKAFKKYQAVA